MKSRLFFSYSHKDEALRDELETHLAMLRREGLIEAWHDRRIIAGSELDQIIRSEIDQANIVLFLLSPDFLASDYCYDVEVSFALKRHQEGTVRVIPVILRPCEWQRTPFGSLLATPTDGKAITKWPDRDDAFLVVTRAIRQAVEDLHGTTEPTVYSAAPLTSPNEHPFLRKSSRRSSNLRVAKVFTQRDQADFLDQTFEFLAKFFEGTLEELAQRNAAIETRFRRIDANRMTAVIYRSGDRAAACTIFRGGLAGGSSQICYSMDEDAGTNGYNEAVSVDYDEQSLFMTTLGMFHFGHGRDQKAKLTSEGVAEMFWSILIHPLQ